MIEILNWPATFFWAVGLLVIVVIALLLLIGHYQWSYNKLDRKYYSLLNKKSADVVNELGAMEPSTGYARAMTEKGLEKRTKALDERESTLTERADRLVDLERVTRLITDSKERQKFASLIDSMQRANNQMADYINEGKSTS